MMPQLNTTRTGGDSLTILTSAGPRLTKVWDSATGKPQGYERAQQVSVQERYVEGINDLSILLTELEPERNSCLIRGRFIGHAKAKELYPQEIEQDRKRGKSLVVPKEGFTLRRLTFFKDQALHFFYIDIDRYQPEGIDPVADPENAINQYIERTLPACFQGITFHWQLSSGAGHPDNAGILKAHVAFWLSKPHLGEDLDAWVKSKNLPIDVTVFRTVQPNYTAAPVFVNGVQDPVPVRSGLCVGMLGDEVDLVIEPAILLRAKTERKSRSEMVDPREKDNLIGLFCRTYEIEEVIEKWLAEVFEFVTDTRLTWLLSGSGATEGAGITDNRQGIFNTSSSDPFGGRAANKWDLVRHYKFGHLDVGIDAFELVDVNSRPSQIAMKEFVNDLPEIKAQTISVKDAYKAEIAAAADEAAIRAICQRVKVDPAIDTLAIDILVPAFRNRLREITGVNPSIKAVKEMLARERNRAITGLGAGPEWVRSWCYVTSQAKFFNLNSKDTITRDAFDAAHCRYMPPDENGNVPSAAKVACDIWQIPIVSETMYLPTVGDTFTLDGRDYANVYQPELVPLSIPDPAADAVLMRHFDLVFSDKEARDIFLQWAAWVVKNPGRKVMWACLIKGVEGDGKSVIGNMLRSAMGAKNVGDVGPETLSNSAFNDWAANRCVVLLEEIKLQGHNRHDVYNKLKPLIANSRIEVHRKGRASVTEINTVNYIAFTNHSDALPLNDEDRRFFAVATPWRQIGEFHDAIKALGFADPRDYWVALHNVVNDNPEAVRAFFEAIDVSKFDPAGRAPQTQFKRDMVAAGDLDDAEGYAKFYIDNGAYGVSKDVLSSGCLSKALAEQSQPVSLLTSRMRKFLENQGFKQVVQVVKWRGSAHRVWIRDGVPGLVVTDSSDNFAHLRAILDRTTDTATEDFLQ
ncbi:MAG: hypothetical protein CGW95_04905 [Phenylobacterium zucineum]|nr:MAG: hypothetical protein CGW95_04905 [Phenylobacterium zucineum]